ncbi:hypothetical protein [Pedobacter antarcticus]|uniref:hypothetical protein n=1 Tax=Pedobacter antarcticus TaxID=34086 RepID=UPI00292F36E8|nr:hypothetical protein [Pedobacter antarcticus]
MKTTEIEFNEVKIEDLEGNTVGVPAFYQKMLGNRLYTSAPDIDTADLGRKIHESERAATELNLSQEELQLLVNLFDQFVILGFPLHSAIKQYLTNKLTSFKN